MKKEEEWNSKKCKEEETNKVGKTQYHVHQGWIALINMNYIF